MKNLIIALAISIFPVLPACSGMQVREDPSTGKAELITEEGTVIPVEEAAGSAGTLIGSFFGLPQLGTVASLLAGGVLAMMAKKKDPSVT